MNILIATIGLLLSIFSTAVMSYISMATPIGPWIGPTLVLCAMLLLRLCGSYANSRSVALATSAGSVGGILATGFGFSFPTLYFLDPQLFNMWMDQFFYFAAMLGILGVIAGGFGIWIANVLEDTLIVQQQLAFPIGQLIYKMISAHNQLRKAYELMIGFIGTVIFGFLQDGFLGFKGIIPKTFVLIHPLRIGILHIPRIPLDIWPMLWAIGFVTGHVIALPLALGAFAKIVFADPIHRLFFNQLSNVEFILAFCSGMILYGTIIGFFRLLKILSKTIGNARDNKSTRSRYFLLFKKLSGKHAFEFFFWLFWFVAFFYYLNFSFLTQIYILLFTLIFTYQMALIAGKMGLAPLGRFATFVMLPAMFLFKLDIVQIVVIATFVEVCGGVTADILFGRKMAQLAHIEHNVIKKYQYLGLFASSMCIGIIVWLLISRFGLGSPELFAYKAQSRQLLINAHNFDYYVLILGALFSFCLKYINVNPTLVLGGLLMPLNISLGLILGGLCTLLTKEKEEWFPLWSGIFAANSIWMLIKTIL